MCHIATLMYGLVLILVLRVETRSLGLGLGLEASNFSLGLEKSLVYISEKQYSNAFETKMITASELKLKQKTKFSAELQQQT